MQSTWPFGSLQPFSFDVVVIDPATPFKLRSEKGNKKSAHAKYKVIPWKELATWPMADLGAPDSLFLVWGTGHSWPKTYDLMRAWGITYKTELVWPKMTKTGKHRYGTGYCARSMHEPILLGTVGNPKYKPLDSLIPGLAREHSRKPEEFYAHVVSRTPHLSRRCDIFAREARPGFIAWGDQQDFFQ